MRRTASTATNVRLCDLQAAPRAPIIQSQKIVGSEETTRRRSLWRRGDVAPIVIAARDQMQGKEFSRLRT